MPCEGAVPSVLPAVLSSGTITSTERGAVHLSYLHSFAQTHVITQNSPSVVGEVRVQELYPLPLVVTQVLVQRRRYLQEKVNTRLDNSDSCYQKGGVKAPLYLHDFESSVTYLTLQWIPFRQNGWVTQHHFFPKNVSLKGTNTPRKSTVGPDT